MRQVKVFTKNGNKIYEVDGVKYENFDDLPDDCKRLVEDKNGNGVPDFFENKEKQHENDGSLHKITTYQRRTRIPDELAAEIEEKRKKGEFTGEVAKEYLKKIKEQSCDSNIDDVLLEYDYNNNEKQNVQRESVTKITHYNKRYKSVDEMPPELVERIKKGEIPTISKEDFSKFEKQSRKSNMDTNTQKNYFQTNEPQRQYCDHCGTVLSENSFLGYIKCEYCGKRTKKKK